MKKILRIIGIPILLFGVFSFDTDSFRWGIAAFAVYAAPICLSFIRLERLALISLWVAIFLLLQNFIPASNYISMEPDHSYQIDIPEGNIPGISGLQTIETDSHGYRTTRKINYDSKSGLRVVTIGGSTTFNIFLDNRATWNHILQENLTDILGRPVEVINAGISGMMMKHHYETLKVISRYNPDLVIFLLGVNDWNWQIKDHFRSSREKLELARKRFFFSHSVLGTLLEAHLVKPVKEMFSDDAEEPASVENDNNYITVKAGDDINKKRGSLYRKENRIYQPETVSSSYSEYLGNVSRYCQHRQIICVFVNQPTGYREEASREFRESFWMTPPNVDYTLDFKSLVHISTLYNDYLAKFARDQNHAFCDLASSMEPSAINYIDECHFNIHGARRVAELLTPCILDILENSDLEEQNP